MQVSLYTKFLYLIEYIFPLNKYLDNVFVSSEGTNLQIHLLIIFNNGLTQLSLNELDQVILTAANVKLLF